MNQLKQCIPTIAVVFSVACSGGKDAPRMAAVRDADAHAPQRAEHTAADADGGGGERMDQPSSMDHGDQHPDHPNSDKLDAGKSGDAAVKQADAGDHRTDDDAGDTHGQRCSIGTQHVDPAAATIWLVIDGSGSQDDPLDGMPDGKSKFDLLKEALMDPNTGVVKVLEHDVKWGLWMFDGPGGGVRADGGMFSSGTATTCPRVISVQPKLDNFADIAARFPPDPLGGSSPTDKALDQLLAQLPPNSMSDGATVVVLATDGAPNNLCDGGNPFDDVNPLVIAEVQKLTDRNIKTYVISLAGNDQMLMKNLADVAKTGATGQAPFVPQNTDDLRSVLQTIGVHDPGCALRLATNLTLAQRCDISVKLGGAALACDAADGFSVAAPSTVQLLGSACQHYKDNPSSLQVEEACPQP